MDNLFILSRLWEKAFLNSESISIEADAFLLNMSFQPTLHIVCPQEKRLKQGDLDLIEIAQLLGIGYQDIHHHRSSASALLAY
jgi:hypothetical protein